MDLRKLEIFLAVVEAKSFSAAARALPMAQPAVSIAVAKLEQELGFALLQRGGRTVNLTPEGTRVAERARRILEDVQSLQQSASELRGLLTGELRIACPSMLATYFLPGLLGDFLDRHPGLSASVTQAGTARVESMLRDDLIELGVVSMGVGESPQDLELIPLVEETMLLCVAQTHPLASRRRVGAKTLEGLPMVVYEGGYFVRRALDQLCSEHAVTPQLRLQTDFLPLIVRMVRQGVGATVGLRMLAEQEGGIVGIPFSPAVRVPLALARRRGRRLSVANAAFVEWLAAGRWSSSAS